MKKIFAIVGSTRRNSSNEAILKLIQRLYHSKADIEIYTELETLPHFNPDVENEAVLPSVENFRNKIQVADGILICTPEYVFSLPGALKTALEWTVSTTVFSDKPCAFIVASGLGEKTFESLGLIMNTILQYQMKDESKLLLQGARGKVNAKGEIEDMQVLENIKRVVDNLIEQMEHPRS
jgi:chromate reductase, NAD(P)H dehydrogenase (quinone)